MRQIHKLILFIVAIAKGPKRPLPPNGSSFLKGEKKATKIYNQVSFEMEEVLSLRFEILALARFFYFIFASQQGPQTFTYLFSPPLWIFVEHDELQAGWNVSHPKLRRILLRFVSYSEASL